MRNGRPGIDALLAWYFVLVWGSGFLASKVGMQYAPPLTFLALRFTLGLIISIPIVLIARPAWPATLGDLGHVIVAGLLIHAVQLSGSHYAQYLGMSAGVVAVILSLQPLLTAVLVTRLARESLTGLQWLGVVLGLAGVVLIVWHKIDVREITAGSLAGAITALLAMTVGTLYQRRFCPRVDLRASTLIQFAATVVTVVPIAWAVEGLQVQWTWSLLGSLTFLVIASSILAVSAINTLMRRGQATRVTSLLYLTPIVAVTLEFFMFGVLPGAIALGGIAAACLGVWLVSLQRARRQP